MGEPHRLNLTVIDADRVTWTCGVLLSPSGLVHYNPDNRHLQLRVQDNDGVIPLVVVVDTTDDEAPVVTDLQVSLFPDKLKRLRRRYRTRVVA